LGRLTPGRDGAAATAAGGRHVPYGCWRTFMSFFCAARVLGGSGGAEGSGAPGKQLVYPSLPSVASVPRPMHSTPFQKSLLAPVPNGHTTRQKKCLVLDLDETLVHSSFKPIPNPDFVLEIELEGVMHKV
jgi:hypothetical protein